MDAPQYRGALPAHRVRDQGSGCPLLPTPGVLLVPLQPPGLAGAETPADLLAQVRPAAMLVSVFLQCGSSHFSAGAAHLCFQAAPVQFALSSLMNHELLSKGQSRLNNASS